VDTQAGRYYAEWDHEMQASCFRLPSAATSDDARNWSKMT
jgi:hypothetical protein